MSRAKYKKQFRLYDIYRYLAIGQMSSIRDLKSYKVDRNGTLCIITLIFENGIEMVCHCNNEQDFRDVVRSVNMHLGNCSKPGRKSFIERRQRRFKI